VIAYLDTSALLRLVLREEGALEKLRSCEALISSELLAVESLRTIDRLRLQGALSIDEAASTRATVTDWLEAVDLVLLQRPILARASDPFPAPLGTLDALHLATILVWRERMQQALVLATHDTSLALAARAFGIEVLGVEPASPRPPVLRTAVGSRAGAWRR
jgi:predicted nucleic acid-binding protein